MQMISGEEFNKINKDILWKLTNEEEIHNGYKYSDGLNIDPIPFNIIRQCSPGGFYFTKEQMVHKWILYGNSVMKWMRPVEIPPDAKVYMETPDKYKTDKFILGLRVPVNEYFLIKSIANSGPESVIKLLNGQAYNLANKEILIQAYVLMLSSLHDIYRTLMTPIETLSKDEIIEIYVRSIELNPNCIKLIKAQLIDPVDYLKIALRAFELSEWAIEWIDYEALPQDVWDDMCVRWVNRTSHAYSFKYVGLTTISTEVYYYVCKIAIYKTPDNIHYINEHKLSEENYWDFLSNAFTEKPLLWLKNKLTSNMAYEKKQELFKLILDSTTKPIREYLVNEESDQRLVSYYKLVYAQ